MRSPRTSGRSRRSDGASGSGGPTARVVLTWLLRAAWLALPFTAGAAVGDAVRGASLPVRATVTVGVWVGWSAGVAALAVVRPASLTALRLVAPAALAATLAAAAAGHPSSVAVVVAAAATLLVLTPEVADALVNGAAYPNEHRYPLRTPAALLAGPLVVAWALAVAGAAAGPLLLAARQWVAGAIVTAAGIPLAALLVRRLHVLARRWVVLVPAGLVLHDPLTLLDPILFQRRVVEALRPARAGTDSLDLTQGAPGLALELVLTEKVPMALQRGRGRTEEGASARLLFTPARPGAVLAAARERRIPVAT